MTLIQTFQAADGASLAFRDEGDGPPVLALAGLTRDGRDFDYLARRLTNVRLIRLDSRGRGASDWTGPDTYNVPQEAQDALALLDHLHLDRAAVIGSSRGGLLGMVMAATAPARIAGLCLNDVGPVLERTGLERIGRYIGETPAVATLNEIADRMPLVMPGFDAVPDLRWAEEALRHYVETGDGLGLPYDPALRQSFDAAMAGPLPEAWPLFDACKGLPLALIHGTNSDVLAVTTADAMQARRPDMVRVELADRGHIPFLDEPEALAAIDLWLGRCFPGAYRSLFAPPP
ncbi:alpha/beta fold hydrolase [Enterovirga rhinocerotis]|uniref:Pimeloyl-ACP methyl ester carboxylesterase n=1 Tax=Enterovirga rhinocerotis TaxID=1339210 RepID=A0A4R7C9A6_9HYPH|nr:alpha/beta hydrolase [Enterovirga rhinocerotis]TDR93486.1 pimeloyl-ACP methyl ester carboxylesterase [Enterovirga rhinocerotis]